MNPKFSLRRFKFRFNALSLPLGVDFPGSGENVCEADKRGPDGAPEGGG